MKVGERGFWSPVELLALTITTALCLYWRISHGYSTLPRHH
jgi:hypothetical protein